MPSRPAVRGVVAPVVAVLVGSLLLSACGGPAPEPAVSPAAATQTSAQEGESSPEPAAAAEPVVIEREIAGATAEIAVGPVVRDGELAVLPVSTTATGDSDINLAEQFEFPYYDIGRLAPDGVRLVDTVQRTVALTAHDDGGTQAVQHDESTAQPGQGPATLHALFAAPAGDTTAVLIPNVGLIPDVPVVADGPVAATDITSAIDAEPGDLVAPVRTLDTYREVDAGRLRTRQLDEQTTVAIDTDVLFGNDSAELSPDAGDALEQAGAELAGVTAGELVVVGHTDDVGTDAHNQELSESRAEAVADRLGDLVDLSGLDVGVEGRGNAEPAVPDTSTEARALNRRVELQFASPDNDGADAVHKKGPDGQAGELPETDGPVGSAKDGVVVSYQDDEVRVSVESVQRVDTLLVGELRLERVSGEPGAVPWAVSQAARDGRGAFAPRLQFAATGVTLLTATNGRSRWTI